MTTCRPGAAFRGSLPALQGDSVYARWLDGLCRIWLGTVHFLRGDADGAVALVEEGLASAHLRGDRLSAYIALFNLSEIAMAQQRYEDAHGHLLEGVRLTRETGDLANLVYFLQALTVVESAAGRHSRVSVLVGAADAVRETVGAGVYGYYKPDEALRAQAAATALEALGEEVHGDCLDAGRALSAEEAVAYALGEGDGAPSPV